MSVIKDEIRSESSPSCSEIYKVTCEGLKRMCLSSFLSQRPVRLMCGFFSSSRSNSMDCNEAICETAVSCARESWVSTWTSQPAWRSLNVSKNSFHTFGGILISDIGHLRKKTL